MCLYGVYVSVWCVCVCMVCMFPRTRVCGVAVLDTCSSCPPCLLQLHWKTLPGLLVLRPSNAGASKLQSRLLAKRIKGTHVKADGKGEQCVPSCVVLKPHINQLIRTHTHTHAHTHTHTHARTHTRTHTHARTHTHCIHFAPPSPF